jgi:hypothetical protein
MRPEHALLQDCAQSVVSSNFELGNGIHLIDAVTKNRRPIALFDRLGGTGGRAIFPRDGVVGADALCEHVIPISIAT